jgi:hypothetical protein
LEVDPNAQPLLERLSCEISIDHDYVANVHVRAGNRGSEGGGEFHRLEFGLALGHALRSVPAESKGSDESTSRSFSKTGSARVGAGVGSVAFRPNVAVVTSSAQERSCVAGDLAHAIWPDMFNKDRPEATVHQIAECAYYSTCSYCNRTAFQIERFGPIAECNGRGCYRREWGQPASSPSVPSRETSRRGKEEGPYEQL